MRVMRKIPPPQGSPAKRDATLVAVVAAGTAGLAVYQWSKEPAQVTGRMRPILVGSSFENQLGKSSFQNLCSEQAHNIYPQYHPHTLRVRRIAERIIAANTDVISPDLHWEFVVIRNPAANAAVFPGGKVFVFTGMLDLIASDDELAVVLAHEIGHTVARHGAEKLTRQFFIVAGVLLVAALFGFSDPSLLSGIGDVMFGLPNSRKLETEADFIGLTLMTRACFNPQAAPQFFQRLQAKSGAEVPKFLSTHPSGSDRITKLSEWLPEFVDRYHDRCWGRGAAAATAGPSAVEAASSSLYRGGHRPLGEEEGEED